MAGQQNRTPRIITDETGRGREWAWSAHPEHGPTRPTWLCNSCGKPWPCDEKKKRLLAEVARDEPGVWTHVHMYLAAQMVKAAEDMRAWTPGDLHERFLGWVKRPS